MTSFFYPTNGHLMIKLSELRNLSYIRKHQQIAKCFLAVAAALTAMLTTKTVIDEWGASGAIYNEYIYSILTVTILSIGPLAQYPIHNAIVCSRIAIVSDFIAVLCCTLAAYGIYRVPLIVTGILCITLTNVLMRSIYGVVESNVVNGEREYSLLDTKLMSLYALVGALLGASTYYLEVNIIIVGIMTYISLLVCRSSRLKLVTHFF